MAVERLTATTENLDLDLPAGDVEIGYAYPATMKAMTRLMMTSRVEEDLRSGWRWFRLANGDLILGVWPQAEGYEMVEGDAHADYMAAQRLDNDNPEV